MRDNHPETRLRRTWFGITAQVAIGPGFLHRAGIGRVLIPHPPVANWLLRLGMAAAVRRKLSFVHEFAHFQTAPVVLLSMIALVSLAFLKHRLDVGGILILLAGLQALWEILSEGLVILMAPARYHAWYEGIPLWPRVIFWNVSAFLVSAAGLSFVDLTS